jgi:guanylate kinase
MPDQEQRTEARGPLIIVSGPSGSGKSTLIHLAIVSAGLPLHLSVSATTRARRVGEEDGKDYHFWTRERFETGLAEGEFLEHARVHGQLYGTLRSEVEPFLARGEGVILDIDVQGFAAVRPHYPEYLSIFVKLSDFPMYEQRLRRRGSETEESIARRLAAAREEEKHIHEYQHVLINDDLETAVREFTALVVQAFGPKAVLLAQPWRQRCTKS